MECLNNLRMHNCYRKEEINMKIYLNLIILMNLGEIHLYIEKRNNSLLKQSQNQITQFLILK